MKERTFEHRRDIAFCLKMNEGMVKPSRRTESFVQRQDNFFILWKRKKKTGVRLSSDSRKENMRQVFAGRFSNKIAIPHYYGDTVRKIFLLSAFLMLFFMPFFLDYLPISFQLGLIVVLVLSVFSGLTNPKSIGIAVADTVISIAGVLIFGFFMVEAYMRYSSKNGYFWVTEVLAGLFLVSLYYSVKTLRGLFLNRKDEWV